MGVEAVGVTLAAAFAANSYVEQKQAAKEAANERKRSERTAQNARMNKEFETRRQQIRQERVRRAQIAQQSENTGVTMSSGQIGAESAINTQVGANISAIRGDTLASQAIGYYNQKAADADFRGQVAQATGQLGMTLAGGLASYGASTAVPTPQQRGVGQVNRNMSPSEVPNPYNTNLFE